MRAEPPVELPRAATSRRSSTSTSADIDCAVALLEVALVLDRTVGGVCRRGAVSGRELLERLGEIAACPRASSAAISAIACVGTGLHRLRLADRVLGVVEDFVESRGELEDVLELERRREGVGQRFAQLALARRRRGARRSRSRSAAPASPRAQATSSSIPSTVIAACWRSIPSTSAVCGRNQCVALAQTRPPDEQHYRPDDGRGGQGQSQAKAIERTTVQRT